MKTRIRKPRINKETPPANVGGTIYVRRTNGHKLTFVLGGADYEQARKIVIERYGWVALWQPHNDHRMFYVHPDSVCDVPPAASDKSAV